MSVNSPQFELPAGAEPELPPADSLEARARQLRAELSGEAQVPSPPDAVMAYRIEEKPKSDVEILQSSGVYPCRQLGVEQVIPPSPEEEQLIRKAAAVCLRIPENQIATLETVQQVSQRGQKVFATAAFERPLNWAVTHLPEELQRLPKKFLESSAGVYRLQLQDGNSLWIRRDPHLNIIEPLGGEIFVSDDPNFDQNNFHPQEIPLAVPAGDRRCAHLLGPHTDSEAFYNEIVTVMEERYGKVGQDIDLHLLGVGAPGKSGPIIKISFLKQPERLTEFFSASQLASHYPQQSLLQMRDILRPETMIEAHQLGWKAKVRNALDWAKGLIQRKKTH